MKNGTDDSVLGSAQKFKEEALVPMKEDIADWMSTILTPQKIIATDLLDSLCTGVLACLLSQKLCDMINNDIKPPKVNSRAKVGTFFARDNAANFLTWCRTLGVSESLLFESDGMCSSEVSQQTPRQVLLCFLEIARIFGRRNDYKGALPDLVKFEQEIDSFSTESNSSGRNSAPPVIKATPNKTPTKRITPRKSPRPKTAGSPRNTLLDESINKVAQSEPFNGSPEIQRVSEGKYRIDGKLVFIRMLKDRHVMVRVGGGWDTLANYLLKHDCQKMVRIPTPTKYKSNSNSPMKMKRKGSASSALKL